ncbi:MAG: hypothetical protein QG657_5300 [Acidobacteriota bacterium]|nr:hypothetical protein [Acidobacteriota bacterium]
MKDNINAILISNSISGGQQLFILLAADGSINRSGPNHPDLFIGITKDTLFMQLRELINNEWFHYAGVYDIPEKVGELCELTIIFVTIDGKEIGMKFLYGKESQGLPKDISDFVSQAISITDSWYDRQKAIVMKATTDQKKRKKWWKLW